MLHEIYRAFLEARISMTTRLLTANYCITHDRCDSHVVCTYVHMCEADAIYVQCTMARCMYECAKEICSRVPDNELSRPDWSMNDAGQHRWTDGTRDRTRACSVAHRVAPLHPICMRSFNRGWKTFDRSGSHLRRYRNGRIFRHDDKRDTLCCGDFVCVGARMCVCVRFGNKIAVCYRRCRTWNPKTQILYNVGMRPSNFWV